MTSQKKKLNTNVYKNLLYKVKLLFTKCMRYQFVGQSFYSCASKSTFKFNGLSVLCEQFIFVGLICNKAPYFSGVVKLYIFTETIILAVINVLRL